MWCYRSHVALCLLLCSAAALAQFGDYRQSPSSGLFIQVHYLPSYAYKELHLKVPPRLCEYGIEKLRSPASIR